MPVALQQDSFSPRQRTPWVVCYVEESIRVDDLADTPCLDVELKSWDKAPIVDG